MLNVFKNTETPISATKNIAGDTYKINEDSRIESMKPVVFLMSIFSGVVISRIAHQTFLATAPVGVCMGVCFVILVGWGYFFEVLSILINLLV